jgi:futalosine hydrolase
MYLALAATTTEMQAFDQAAAQTCCQRLVTGVGIVETTLSLTRWLAGNKEKIHGVVNFGIGGAYLQNNLNQQAKLLDICLAKREVLGDFGVCLKGDIEQLQAGVVDVQQNFSLDTDLLQQGRAALSASGISCKIGTFVTVQCVSGTASRGNLLGRNWQALCESMEGAAVARVCRAFSVPCLEVRCMSNLVEDRNRSNWKIRHACDLAGKAAAVIINTLSSQGGRQ